MLYNWNLSDLSQYPFEDYFEIDTLACNEIYL
ncbi:MAG: hypothetical protein ACJAZK_001848 [Psychroserpens sp.]|jgi:hypothetical protein